MEISQLGRFGEINQRIGFIVKEIDKTNAHFVTPGVGVGDLRRWKDKDMANLAERMGREGLVNGVPLMIVKRRKVFEIPVRDDGKERKVTGFYVMPREADGHRPEVQARLDRALADSGMDMMAVDGGVLGSWIETGIVVREPVVDERDNYAFSVGKDETREGDRFMMEEYLPVLVENVAHMGESGMVPGTSLGSSGFDGVCATVGDLLFIQPEKLITTGHSQGIRQSVAVRDGCECQYPKGQRKVLVGGYGVDDLVGFDQLSRFRRTDDPNRQMIGVDSVGFGESGDGNCSVFVRGRILDGRGIYEGLDPDKPYFHLHHIVPRGVAYRALITATLKGDINPNEMSVRQMTTYLRAIRIRDLLENNRDMFTNGKRLGALRVIQENLVSIDMAVNSLWNLICLCPNCHNRIHPDMKYARAIAGYFSDVIMGRIVNGGSVGEIINSKRLKRIGGQMDYGEVMRRLHLARTIISSSGRPYVRGQKQDKMGDMARVSTKRYMATISGKMEGEVYRLVDEDKIGRFLGVDMVNLIRNIAIDEIYRINMGGYREAEVDEVVVAKVVAVAKSLGIKQSHFVIKRKQKRLRMFRDKVIDAINGD